MTQQEIQQGKQAGLEITQFASEKFKGMSHKAILVSVSAVSSTFAKLLSNGDNIRYKAYMEFMIDIMSKATTQPTD